MTDSTGTLPPQQLRLEARGRTDVGRKRPHNEDSIEVSEELRLFAVADGMGGHAAGEVASRAAVETLGEFIAHSHRDRDFTWPFGFNDQLGPGENLLWTAIQLSNRKVCQLAGDTPEYGGMGTTMVVLYLPERVAHIAHVGDSRIYCLRDGELIALTADHSWVNEQLQRNIITEEEARNHRWKNVITRALGNRIELEVDLKTMEARPGDLFVLCSDGLTGMIEESEMLDLLKAHADDLGAACDAMIEAANMAGGLDNISVVLVRVHAA